MSGYLHFIPEFVLCTNSSLFWFRIANKLSEFRNYLNVYKDHEDFWHGFVPPNCSVNVVEVTDGQAVLLEDDKVYA